MAPLSEMINNVNKQPWLPVNYCCSFTILSLNFVVGVVSGCYYNTYLIIWYGHSQNICHCHGFGLLLQYISKSSGTVIVKIFGIGVVSGYYYNTYLIIWYVIVKIFVIGMVSGCYYNTYLIIWYGHSQNICHWSGFGLLLQCISNHLVRS